MKKLNLILFGIILLLLLGGWLGYQHYEKRLYKAHTELRTEKIKNDSLKRVTETQYNKLVADTLKQRELNKIVDSLKIKLDAKPKVIIKTVFVPQEAESPVDSVTTEGDIIKLVDHYPQKENYFVKYSAEVNRFTEDGIGKFSFGKLNINMVISQREDGIYQLDTQLPKWLTISGLRVQSTPLEPPQIDNFGWILGGSYGKDLSTDENYLRLSGGFRYKKFYVIGGASSTGQLDVGAQFEF